MLRIHFTRDDLLRIRIASAADPLWEILLSLHILQSPAGGPAYNVWRHDVLTRLRQDPRKASALRFLAALAPVASYVPDFLTPAEGNTGVDAGIDAVASTPRRRLAEELARLATVHPSPRQLAMTGLANGDTTPLRYLALALRTYHAAALEPYWGQIQAYIYADHKTRLRALPSHGIEGILAGFETICWTPPVLEMPYPADRDLFLDGRGLLLTPSMFCWRTPITLADPTLPPVLVYPVNRPVNWITNGTSAASTQRSVSALLGPTRASLLELLAALGQAGPGELAQLTATTPATVSKHASVLREAGIISSSRNGRYVIHRLTPLGSALLNGPGPRCRTAGA